MSYEMERLQEDQIVNNEHLPLKEALQLSSFPALLPPIVLQQDFAEVVPKQEALQKNLAAVNDQQNNCFNSLTQRAFQGEL